MMASSYVMVVMGGDALTAALVCLAVGALVGLINGFIIVYMRVPDLLATLGMMFLLLGLQRIPTEGRSIAAGMTLPDGSVATGTFSPAFLALGRHRFDLVLPNLVPVSVVVLVVLAIAIWFFLEYTRFGRIMYAVGSNERAAALAGAPVNAYKISAYVISGVFASIGGILLAARLAAAISLRKQPAARRRRRRADRFCRAGCGQAERFRNGRRRAFRRDPTAGPDDDECALLHAGFHQGRRARRRPDLYLCALEKRQTLRRPRRTIKVHQWRRLTWT